METKIEYSRSIMNKLNLAILLTVILACISCKKDPLSIKNTSSTFESATTSHWKDQKLSMMVHLGPYAMLGGMYQGQPVTKGYSEQIMAHAAIPPAEYQAMALNFNPVQFSADSIAQLARRGGFRSVIFTAKHHDGFNMFDTKQSDFSIASTPFKRDILKEMSDACHAAGLGFGVYFSLIDWNAKEGATTISSHNADTIAPALHAANLRQVRELCSNYGDLSEIWFDMGSLTLQQSKEIRDLVKSLQPDCMIGGRIGNGQGDFIVSPDNVNGDMKYETPWQSVNSIYDNTWGYRSWQPIGNAKTKAVEHLGKMIKTVYLGGNYMLNIGPKGDGSIQDFEKQVIEYIGSWIDAGNAEAIYDTRPLPGGDKSWGGLTYNHGNIYAHVMSTPDEGKILLYGLNNIVTGAVGMVTPFTELGISKSGATYTFDLGLAPLQFDPSTSFKIQYEGDLDMVPARVTSTNTQNVYELNYTHANLGWSTDGSNYYATAPSLVSMSWDISAPKEIPYDITLFYTQQEKDKVLNLKINEHIEQIDLSKYKTFRHADQSFAAIPSNIFTQGPYTGLNMASQIGALSWAVPGAPWGPEGKLWDEVYNLEQGQYINRKLEPMQTYYYLMNILASTPTSYIFAFGSDDAFMAWLNGRLLYSTGYPVPNNVVFLDLPLEGESNTLIIKHLNVKGDFKTFFSQKIDQIHFEKPAEYTTLMPKKLNHIELTLANPSNPHENMGTPNIKIIISERKNK